MGAFVLPTPIQGGQMNPKSRVSITRPRGEALFSSSSRSSPYPTDPRPHRPRPAHLDYDTLHWWDTTERQGILPGAELPSTPSVGGTTASPPWNLGFQMSERYLSWSTDLRMTLLVEFAAKELRLPPETVQDRLSALLTLLPPLESKLPTLKADLLARLLDSLDDVAQRLMELKQLLPTADPAVLAAARPSILTCSASDIQDVYAPRVALMRELFPATRVDLVVQDFPALLDVVDMRAAKADLDATFGGQGEDMVRRDPNYILQTQRGKDLIPYDDPVDTSWTSNVLPLD